MAPVFHAVVFDLDGVIADSHPLHEIAWQKLLSEAGKVLPAVQLASLVREGRNRAELLAHFFPDAAAEQHAALAARKDTLYSELAGRLRPIPGVIEWILQLAARQIPLAIATSASRARAVETLERFGIRAQFRAVITASDVNSGKPAPELFLKAASALDLAPASILAIEDSPAGVAAAKAAGMCCALFQPEASYGLSKLKADFTIRSFEPACLAPLMDRLQLASLAAALPGNHD